MINTDINLFFIDLDGTTLDSRKNGKRWISDANLKAIHNARELGKEVIISTGRYSVGLEKYIEAIGGRYSIMSNGAEIMDNKHKRLIYDKRLSKKQLIKIKDFAKKNKLSIRVSGDYNIYGATTFILKMIARKLKLKPQYSYNFDTNVERSKLIIWGKKNARQMETMRRKIENEVDDTIALSTVNGLAIEITHIKSSKGIAAMKIAKLLKVDKQNTAHIGDTMNDSTALDKVGLFIAMKNSDAKLKELANAIGPDYKKGGLAKVLNNADYIIK